MSFYKGILKFLKDEFIESEKSIPILMYNSTDGGRYRSDDYFVVDSLTGVGDVEQTVGLIFMKDELLLVGELSSTDPMTRMFDYRNLAKLEPVKAFEVEVVEQLDLRVTMKGLE